MEIQEFLRLSGIWPSPRLAPGGDARLDCDIRRSVALKRLPIRSNEWRRLSIGHISVVQAVQEMTDSVLSDGNDPHGVLAGVIERCYGELRRYARRKVGDDAVADELVQEACLRLVATGNDLPFNPRAYLYRILSNLVTDHHRHRVRLQKTFIDAVTLDAADDRPDAEREVIGRQRLAILAQAVAELPPRCRECFALRRFEGLSHAEIANRMRISTSAVEKHLAAATVHCARRVKAND